MLCHQSGIIIYLSQSVSHSVRPSTYVCMYVCMYVSIYLSIHPSIHPSKVIIYTNTVCDYIMLHYPNVIMLL